MAQVIQGHTLRSNQYLIARVYDADSLNAAKIKQNSATTETETERKSTEAKPQFINGQILIIKGTECSFYIPPTGIEVKAINNDPSNGYVRNAVTLERLEYCILKDEDGEKRYVHGPAVVFPEPTETFVTSAKGGYVFRAIELSKISGIYVKVIAEYKDGDSIHPVGEELFITGDTQMIYYPRPEHAIISYDNKIVHHAIAIPEGEGRYIMNRLTGVIKTVKGPEMYLPDPRTEVVVRRKLTPRQCALWYPDNAEAMAYNKALNEKAVEKRLKAVDLDNTVSINSNDGSTLASLEAGASISRGTSYTKPRTITLDSKYEGVVSVDVWTGYAINIISKNGAREVKCGPQTVLLDYDQTLETLELSTGKPKSTDKLQPIAFLRYENNRVSDIINVETADFVRAEIKVSYLVNFDKEKQDKWFAIDNYVKHLTDWTRSRIKREVRQITIGDFCENYHDLVIEAIKDNIGEDAPLHRFDENGMCISDVEVLSMHISDENVQEMIDDHQMKIVSRALDLNAARNSADTERQIVELNREKVTLAEEYARYKANAEAETKSRQYALQVAYQKAKDDETYRKTEVECEIQELKDIIFKAEQERQDAGRKAELVYREAVATMEAEREAKSALAMQTVLQALGPDLAAALNSTANEHVVKAIAESIAPYAIAKGESVASAVNTLVRGSSLEELLSKAGIGI